MRSNGNVGPGTSSPQADLHVIENHLGAIPTIRLMAPNAFNVFDQQHWEISGTYHQFLISDVTNSNAIPFRVERCAPTNSQVIDSNGDVGFGTAAPAARVEVLGDIPVVMRLANTEGGVNFRMDAGDTGNFWNFTAQIDSNGGFVINNNDGPGSVEFLLSGDGDLTIKGGTYHRQRHDVLPGLCV